MTRDIIDINDFIILVETANSENPIADSCYFDEPLIAVAFYGSGNVHLNVEYGNKEKEFNHTKGLALSFYANEKVKFTHTVSASKPLECIVIATSVVKLNKLPSMEGQLFTEMLDTLVNPSDHFVKGPGLFMTPEMQSIVDLIFNNKYEGKAKMLFFKSQVTSLLAHFFGQLSILSENTIPKKERDSLNKAKELLTQNLDNPPSLSELSMQIGINTFKLKKNFKELFGVPVFKYLQNERLSKAHHILQQKEMTIQEVAWHVGYESLGSFSNAFTKKFGFRPSDLRS